MKRILNSLFFLLFLGGIGYAAYHFGIIDKYSYLFNQKDNPKSDSLSVVEVKPQKKFQNKKKRPQRANPYYKLEKYAFNTPKSKTKTIGDLAGYLGKGATNEYEK